MPSKNTLRYADAMTIRIVTDSACDLPQHLVDQHGIGIVPLSFRFGDEEFIDRQSLTVAQFWERCSSSPVLPETAAPSPGQFEAEFRRLASQGATGIVVVSLSSELSATMQSAELAAKSLSGDISVRVVDSRSASMGQGITAVAVAKLAASGASLDEVERAARDYASRARVWGVLDLAVADLDHRLDRQGGGEECLGSTDSAALLQVLEGVEDAPDAGTRRVITSCAFDLVERGT